MDNGEGTTLSPLLKKARTTQIPLGHYHDDGTSTGSAHPAVGESTGDKESGEFLSSAEEEEKREEGVGDND